jgi:hypothetical protein
MIYQSSLRHLEACEEKLRKQRKNPETKKPWLSRKPHDRTSLYPERTSQVIIGLSAKFHRELSQFVALVSRSTGAG